MPNVYTVAEVKIPEAELLADLYSIQSDLRSAAIFCEKATDIGDAWPHDSQVEEALVVAAIIRYCRCFSTGVRLHLNESNLVGLLPADLERHRYFKNLRDKFVAHSVNAFEETYVTTTLRQGENDPRTIKKVSMGKHTVVLHIGEARALHGLIAKIESLISDRVEKEEQKLIEFIHTVSPEILQTWDLHTPSAASAGDVSKWRQRRIKPRL